MLLRFLKYIFASRLFFCEYEYMCTCLHLPDMSGVFVYSLFEQFVKKDTTVPANVPVT